MKSSYIKNNFGEIFESIVKENKPQLIVEVGVFHGYSTLHMAKGLKYNKENSDVLGHLDAYDLWDDYPFNHGDLIEVQKLIDENELTNLITLYKGDAFEVQNNYRDGTINLLHIDIYNTGEMVRKAIELWHRKVNHKGIILFEGGSVERDNISWMVKLKKSSIREEINSNGIINKFYAKKIYEKFPSLTFLRKK